VNLSTSPLPVLVAGGGIGGLATAIALRAAGHRVVVLEKSSEFGEIGAGIQLGPNAFHALKILDVAERVLENAVYIDRLVMMDAVTGLQVAAIPVDEPFRRWFKNPYAVIHRADLHSSLLDRCKLDSEVQLLANHEVTSFTQNSGGVEVQTASGVGFRGAALIGADGVRSRVREPIVGDGGPKISGHVCYRAVLPLEQMPEGLRQNAAVLWAGPKSHFVHYPLRGWKLFNIVATFHSAKDTAEQHNVPGHAEELMCHFGHLPPLPRSVLERSDGWRRWVLGDRDPVANWTQGNVTLLGDAAHPTLQYFAQGACMALEDAVCLMAELKRTPGDFGAAFQSYQTQRITRTARIVLSSRAIGQYFYHAEGVERLVRNQMLGEKSAEDFYRSLDWIYGYQRDKAA
jgi:2-polyprenyl-6-methoxyphenol hydroxylase-like FAD-dependent oxidoreductase